MEAKTVSNTTATQDTETQDAQSHEAQHRDIKALEGKSRGPDPYDADRRDDKSRNDCRNESQRWFLKQSSGTIRRDCKHRTKTPGVARSLVRRQVSREVTQDSKNVGTPTIW